MHIYTRQILLIVSISVLFINLHLTAQIPVLKVDLNIGSRQETEVNEPGYIPWPINGGPDSMSLEGVKIVFNNGTVSAGWYKAGVQAPNYARLVNDGILTSKIEICISGLQNGKHTLVTFHNTFDNPETNIFSPMDVYMNNQLVYDDLELTNRALSNPAATTAFFEFEVTNNDTVVLRFESDPKTSGVNDKIAICGFHLNSSDPNKMAKYPYPEDRDEHVDIDNDTLILKWVPPESAVSQDVYFGKNISDIISADTTSACYIGNLTDTFFVRTGFYSMDNYYWRIDPINSSGEKTRGDVWYFKKRILAFPGAEGYGKYAIGGRGGKVIYVNNLNDNGPGSFREAVEKDIGPRTILFAVSGLITLSSRLVINDDYITVAGQTTPGKGICFRWAPIGVTGNNLIVQNIRVRLGDGITYDGMGLTGAEYSIIDHCSISWTIDEAFSSRGAKNITLQRTLISEALNAAGHSNYPPGTEHGYAGSIGGDIGSFHHNLLAHCQGRNWSLAGGLDGDGYYAGKLDIFNNLVYNWGGRATDGGAHEVNFVNNYYKKGKASTQNNMLKADLEGTGKGTQSYFYSGNILENTDGSLACDGTDNTCARIYTLSNGQILDWEVFVDNPFFPSEASIHSAKDAYKNVLSDVGCTQPVFDDHDNRIVNETLKGAFSCYGSLTGKPGLPDSVKDVGSWERYPGNLRNKNWDTDLDGLPNWWEKTYGLDTNSAAGDFSETHVDPDKNGYTHLEEYLQWMDRPHYFMLENEILDIDLSMYTQGYTKSPVYEILNSINGNAEIINNSAMVKFIPYAKGLAEFEFKVIDTEGSSHTQKIGVYIGQIEADSLFSYSYYKDRQQQNLAVVGITAISDVSENAADEDNFAAFPNPTDGIFFVQFEISQSTTAEIVIYSITGAKIKVLRNHYNPGLYKVEINMEYFKSGIFIVQFTTDYNRAGLRTRITVF